MNRWWLVIALLLSVGLNVGILATIAARRGGPPPAAKAEKAPELANPGGRDPLPLLPRLADRLGLEGEKRRKFLDIQWNLFQETSRQRLQLEEVHRDIRRELTRDAPDRQRVDQLLAESARIYLAMERAMVSNVFATRELLDADQERQYLALIGRLRIAGGAAGGLGGNPALGPGAAQRPQNPAQQEMRRQMMEQMMEQRRLRQQMMRERFPGRFPGRQRRFQQEPPQDQPPQDQESPP